MSEKTAEALKTIGEVAKELNLIELETGKAKLEISVGQPQQEKR